MRANARLGGHIVQGHVDGRGVLISKAPKGRDFALTFRCGRVIACGCVEKGSIAVNGVSLTVSGLGDDWFRVDVIPTTLRETNLGMLKVGDSVNLETDVLGKYARKGFVEDVEPPEPETESGLTMEKLIENGFV